MRQLLVYKWYREQDKTPRAMDLTPVSERLPAGVLSKLFLEAKMHAEGGGKYDIPFADFWRQEVNLDIANRCALSSKRTVLGNGDAGEVHGQGGVFLTNDPFRIVVKVTEDLPTARARYDLVKKMKGVLQVPPQLKPFELTLPSGRTKVYELIEYIPGVTFGGVFRSIDSRCYYDEDALRLVFLDTMLGNFERFARATYDAGQGHADAVKTRYEQVIREGVQYITHRLGVPAPQDMSRSQMEKSLERLVQFVPDIADVQVGARLDNSPENVIWRRELNPLGDMGKWDRTSMDLCVLAYPRETARARLEADTFHIDLGVRKRALLAEDVAQAVIVHPTPLYERAFQLGLECLADLEHKLELNPGELQQSLSFCTLLRALRKTTLLDTYVQQSLRHRSAGLIDSAEYNARIATFSLECFKYVKVAMVSAEDLACRSGRAREFSPTTMALRHVYESVMRHYGQGSLFADAKQCA